MKNWLLSNMPPNYGEVQIAMLAVSAIVLTALCLTMIVSGLRGRDLQRRGINWNVHTMRRRMVGIGVALGALLCIIPKAWTSAPFRDGEGGSFQLVVLGINLLLGIGMTSLLVAARVWLWPGIARAAGIESKTIRSQRLDSRGPRAKRRRGVRNRNRR
jgi:hypothetical protein